MQGMPRMRRRGAAPMRIRTDRAYSGQTPDADADAGRRDGGTARRAGQAAGFGGGLYPAADRDENTARGAGKDGGRPRRIPDRVRIKKTKERLQD